MQTVQDYVSDIKTATLNGLGIFPASYNISVVKALPYERSIWLFDTFTSFGGNEMNLGSFCDGKNKFRLSRKRREDRWKLHLHDEVSGMRMTFRFFMPETLFHESIWTVLKKMAIQKNFVGTNPTTRGDLDVITRNIVNKTVNIITALNTPAKIEFSIHSLSDDELIDEIQRRYIYRAKSRRQSLPPPSVETKALVA